MILVDKEIRVFLENGRKPDPEGQTAIYSARAENITNIGYDLTATGFIRNNSLVDEIDLYPGQSVLVESEEMVIFDHRTCGTVHIKNSRLRMGLSLESPVYQPGHQTKIFFRLTNLSDSIILLSKGSLYATLVFEQLNATPDNPYTGTFQQEEQYKGLAEYTSTYEQEMKVFARKKLDLAGMEKSIYGNIITILSIFVAIFSIINVNFSLAQEDASLVRFLSYNLSLVGGIGFLSALMEEIVHREDRPRHRFWIIPAVCFAAVAVVTLLQ